MTKLDLLQDLLDRKAISDCLQRYARGIDRHDVELVASCYHPDAIDDHGYYVGGGRGLAEEAIGRLSDYPKHQHHITNHYVELEGDSAHAETYYFTVASSFDGVTTFASGRYLDRFERREGEWRIAARVTMLATIVEAPTADMAALDRSFAPWTHDRSDLSYQRPLNVLRRTPEEEHRPAAAAR